MNKNTARTAALSRHMAAGLGPKISESQSEAIDQIRELWALLSPEIQKKLLAELLMSL